jgi:hypothetical protein
VGSVVAWALAKEMYESLWNSVMLLGLDFIPLDQISNISPNDLRRRVATCDKNLTGTQID